MRTCPIHFLPIIYIVVNSWEVGKRVSYTLQRISKIPDKSQSNVHGNSRRFLQMLHTNVWASERPGFPEPWSSEDPEREKLPSTEKEHQPRGIPVPNWNHWKSVPELVQKLHPSLSAPTCLCAANSGFRWFCPLHGHNGILYVQWMAQKGLSHHCSSNNLVALSSQSNVIILSYFVSIQTSQPLRWQFIPWSIFVSQPFIVQGLALGPEGLCVCVCTCVSVCVHACVQGSGSKGEAHHMYQKQSFDPHLPLPNKTTCNHKRIWSTVIWSSSHRPLIFRWPNTFTMTHCTCPQGKAPSSLTCCHSFQGPRNSPGALTASSNWLRALE